jgi:hypothetical protein
MDMNGVLAAAYDPSTASLRVTGANDLIPIPARQFSLAAGSAAIATNNNVESWELDGATVVESLITSFQLPPWWKTLDLDLIWGRRGAGSGNVRWRIVIKDLGNGDLVSEAAVIDTAVTLAVPTQNAVAFALEQVNNLAVSNDRLYSLFIERDPNNAADTFAGDASLFGARLRRA